MSFNEEEFQKKLKDRADAPPPRLIHYLLKNAEEIKGCINNGMTALELQKLLQQCGWKLSYNCVLKNLKKFKSETGMVRSRTNPIREKRTAAQQREAGAKGKVAELQKPSLAERNRDKDL